MSGLSSEKQKMREEFRRRRKAYVSGLDTITKNLVFRRLPSPVANRISANNIIALYSSTTNEAPTLRLTEYFLENGYNICLPIIYEGNIIKFHNIDHLELLESGFQNIPEPPKTSPQADPDVIVAPLIAFDRGLNRLGQGGGYYDRAFANYPNALKIGLAWSAQETDEVPIGRHDVKLDIIVTETEIIE